MKTRIDMRQKHGKWDDEWVEHPLPTLNEPHKAMAWLTADTAIAEDRKADMFLRSGMGVIDNVFAKTRRLINPARAPAWHGERALHRLVRILAVQRRHAREVPDDLPGGEQLRLRRR